MTPCGPRDPHVTPSNPMLVGPARATLPGRFPAHRPAGPLCHMVDHIHHAASHTAPAGFSGVQSRGSSTTRPSTRQIRRRSPFAASLSRTMYHAGLEQPPCPDAGCGLKTNPGLLRAATNGLSHVCQLVLTTVETDISTDMVSLLPTSPSDAPNAVQILLALGKVRLARVHGQHRGGSWQALLRRHGQQLDAQETELLRTEAEQVEHALVLTDQPSPPGFPSSGQIHAEM